MNEHDVDERLNALFAEPKPAADPAFSDRVMALAAFDLAEQQAKRRAVRRVVSEAVALTVVLGMFALLARMGPGAADLGDSIPLFSPAMIGLVMLVLWSVIALRPAVGER